MSKDFAVIIVAAGSSSRMKRAKQLLPLGDSTLLGMVVQNAISLNAGEVVTVLGANMHQIKSSIGQFNTTIIENKDWEKGLGTSIGAGIKYLKSKNYEAVLILLGDQPLIDVEYLLRLLKVHQENPENMVATQYPHSKGVPAIFPKKFFSELATLEGDTGAKILLNGNDSVISLATVEKTLDIDTPEDYIKIVTLMKRTAMEPIKIFLKDDSKIPNNKLPLLIYKNAFAKRGEAGAVWLEERFSSNNWTNSWRNGVHNFHHYHSNTHEVLGIYDGRALLQLGGEQGEKVEVEGGDIIVIPAGVGHKNLESDNLQLVGAYPNGRDYDMNYGKEGERPAVDKNISSVPVPVEDPLQGKGAGVPLIWENIE